MPNDIVPTKTINNVDVTPLLQEVLEYSKSQATLGNVEELISKVPQKDSMDWKLISCLLYTSPSPRDLSTSRMPSSA